MVISKVTKLSGLKAAWLQTRKREYFGRDVQCCDRKPALEKWFERRKTLSNTQAELALSEPCKSFELVQMIKRRRAAAPAL